MRQSIEKRLAKLEDTIRALKGQYATAASAVELVVTESEEFVQNIVAGNPYDIVIRFTPTYGRGHNTMTTLQVVGTSDYQLWLQRIYPPVNLIQNGTGSVDVEIKITGYPVSFSGQLRFKVLALGTSGGTFTRIS